MFTELMPFLCKRRLLLTVSLVEGDTIRATVVPQKAPGTENNSHLPIWQSQARRETHRRSFTTSEVPPHTLEKPFTQRKFTAIVPLVCS